MGSSVAMKSSHEPFNDEELISRSVFGPASLKKRKPTNLASIIET
jgi:hypothetical protein